jgi:hypothetical protein
MPLYDGRDSYVEIRAHTNRYLILVEKDNYHSPLTRLIGFAMSAPDIDFAGAITIPTQRFVNGQPATFNVTARAQYARQYTFTFGFPSANWIFTPVGRLAENLSICRRDYHLLYLCPDDACKQHHITLPDGLMSALEPGDLVVVTDDGTPIEATAQLYIESPRLYVYLRGSLAQDSGDETLAVVYDESENCNCVIPNLVGAYGGGDGVGAPTGETTADEFVTGTDFATQLIADVAALATAIIQGVFLAGETIIVATDSGAAISTSGGTSFTACLEAGGALAGDYNRVYYYAGYYWLLGAAGALLRSSDGVNYTTLSIGSINAATEWNDLAWDKSNNLLYLAGDNAGTGVAAIINGTAVIDISANVAAGANPLLSVWVLAPNHVIYGDGIGLFHEHTEATAASATNLFSTVLSGGTDEIVRIRGDKHRTVAVTTTSLIERSLFTERVFGEMEVLGTIDGNYTDLAQGAPRGFPWPGYNHFVASTDAGELVVVETCFNFE